jgi:hypothetical protein
MRGEISFPAAKAERLRHALMFAMRQSLGLGDEFDAEVYRRADIEKPRAMEAITRAAGHDDADEYAEIIAMLDNQMPKIAD